MSAQGAATLMTPAPELSGPARGVPTGNLQAQLPEVSAGGVVWRLGGVSMGLGGLVDLHGGEEPLLEPRVKLDGQPLHWDDATREFLNHWTPRWTARHAAANVTATVLAPLGERGAAIELMLRATREVSVELSCEFAWAGLEITRFRSRPSTAHRRVTPDPWTGGIVLEPLSDLPLAALGLRAEAVGALEEPRWHIERAEGGPGDVLRGRVSLIQRLRSGETLGLRLYAGLGLEADSARTTSLHLRRVGWDELLGGTLAWLAARVVACGSLTDLVNRNRFFSYFFAQADALDSGEAVMLTSRSPRYYVSGAYWARDALLWAFPSVLQLDLDRAADLAGVAVNRYARLGPGEHAQHLNGAVLYPGFELDQAAAPFAALGSAIEALIMAGRADRAFELQGDTRRALRVLARTIEGRRHATLPLYRTFLSPTDDPVLHPYLTYDNALLASALTRYGQAVESLARQVGSRPTRESGLAFLSWGSRVRETLLASAPAQGRYPFGFSPDAPGGEDWGDAPAGSLLLLPDLGVTSVLDPAWQATAAWVRGPDNPFHYAGAFPGRGSAHFPHPSVFGLVNDLKAGFSAEALSVLEGAPLDDGLACESYAQDTGVAVTGGHFATLAGWLGATLATLAQAGRLGK